jgi:hypothetical protein
MTSYGGMKEHGKGWVPYIISGPLSRGSTMTGYLDALLHVAVWIGVWVFEILTFVALSRHEENVYKDIGSADKDKSHPMAAVSIGSIATLAIATGVIILVLGAHAMTNGIEDGKLPPAATSMITGGLKASIFFSIMVALTSFLIFMMEDMTNISSSPCTSSKDCAHKSAGTLLAEEETFIDFIVVLLLLKFYGLSLMLNNLRFAVAADQPEPHHMVPAA